MSGYEHEHEHGHFQPHTHSHRHQGDRPTEAHERSGMGAHHHQHDAVRPAAPEALDVERLATVFSKSLLDQDFTGFRNWTGLAQEIAQKYAALRSKEPTDG